MQSKPAPPSPERTVKHMITYQDFLNKKHVSAVERGLKGPFEINPKLFDFQRDVVEFHLRTGSSASFLDTGLGKTAIQLNWANDVPGDCLVIAPLAVAGQTVREAEKFSIEASQSRDGTKRGKITITNYERLDRFDLSQFDSVVLDESSILKSFMGKTKQMLCDAFKQYRFKLCCTATPAPNDYMELGNHCDFLSVMSSQEMLTRFFIHDSANTGEWRLKQHATHPFWRWVASWAACVSRPSDLGYDDGQFKLPPLSMRRHIIDSNMTVDVENGLLFSIAGCSATNLHAEKRNTVNERVELVAGRVNQSTEPFIVWCESNQESERLAKAIPDAVEVVGSMSPEEKEDNLEAFSLGKSRVIVTKPSIAGFGLNWQHCANVMFASLSFSYESFYQAVRRSWRFGQKRPVSVEVVTSSNETPVWQTIERKMFDHENMKSAMRIAAKEFADGIKHSVKNQYNPTHKGTLPLWLESKLAA